MIPLLLITLLTGQVDETPKLKPRPAAMVLWVKGKTEIRPVQGQSRHVEIGDLLLPGEVLAVPEDGSATLSILREGVSETIKPGTQAKIGPKGCTPSECVATRKQQPRSIATTMKNLRPSGDDGRKAGVIFRSGKAAALATSPISGSLVTSTRPNFAWPATRKVTTYRLRLLTGAGREAWKADVDEPRFTFPAGKEPLKAGFIYVWEVTDQDYRKLVSSEFSVATDVESAQLGELKSLANSKDLAERYSAAIAYHRLTAFSEAIVVLEGLLKEKPDEPEYRRMLYDLYKIAGRSKDAGKPEAAK